MKRSLALLILALTLSLATLAHAARTVDVPADVTPMAISGRYVFGITYAGGGAQLVRFDARSGRKITISKSAVYSQTGLASDSTFAYGGPGQLTAISVDGTERVLADEPPTASCDRFEYRVLNVDKLGAVTALRIGEQQGPRHDCVRNPATTRLLRFDAAGSQRTLWMPVDLRSWDQFAMRGNLLVAARFASRKPGSPTRFAVVDVARKRTISRFSLVGHRYAFPTIDPSRHLLISAQSWVTRTTLAGQERTLVYRGKPGSITICGTDSVITRTSAGDDRPTIEVRSPKGRRAYRRSFARGSGISVVCSSDLLWFYASNTPAMGDATGSTSVVSTIDLTKLAR